MSHMVMVGSRPTSFVVISILISIPSIKVSVVPFIYLASILVVKSFPIRIKAFLVSLMKLSTVVVFPLGLMSTIPL
jgi:hypothetical protein